LKGKASARVTCWIQYLMSLRSLGCCEGGEL
jgi:hypothetical protein